MTSIGPTHGGTCSMILVQCSHYVGSSTLAVLFSSSWGSSLSCALLAFFSFRDSQSPMRGIFTALDTLSSPISQHPKSLATTDLTTAGQMPAALYVPEILSETLLIIVLGP